MTWHGNPDTFGPALLAASADIRLTAEQWAAELADDRWSFGDRNELVNLALDANMHSANDTYRDVMSTLNPLARFSVDVGACAERAG